MPIGIEYSPLKGFDSRKGCGVNDQITSGIPRSESLIINVRGESDRTGKTSAMTVSINNYPGVSPMAH